MLMADLANRARALRTALAFPGFAWTRLQIAAAEEWTGLVAPAVPALARMLPRCIVIRVTERCFLRCKFCAQGGERGRVDRRRLKNDFIAPEVLQQIAAEASRWTTKPLVKITGGEPLLLGERLFDAMREMRERGLPVMLNTNGMLLQRPRVARRLVEAGLSCLSISLDGGREVHNRLRGSRRLFDAVLAGIANVRRCRDEAGAGPLILLSMVVCSENQHELERLHRIAVTSGVDWLGIEYLNYTTPESCAEATSVARRCFGATPTPWDAFCNPRLTALDPELVAGQLARILESGESLPVYVLGGMSDGAVIARYHQTMDAIRQHVCSLPFTSMHLVTPGRAVFCIDYPFYEYGDVREEGLERVWFGERADGFRRQLLARFREGGGNFPQCRRCNWMFT